MTDYEPMSAPPPGGSGRPTRGEPPRSVRTSVLLVWAIVVVSVVGAVATLVNLDAIVATAMETQPGAVTSTAAQAAVVGALVFQLVILALWVLLAVFLRKGANWARIVLTVLAALGVVFGLFGMFTSQPLLPMIIGVVNVALQAALLFYLWQRDASAWLKPRRSY